MVNESSSPVWGRAFFRYGKTDVEGSLGIGGVVVFNFRTWAFKFYGLAFNF